MSSQRNEFAKVLARAVEAPPSRDDAVRLGDATPDEIPAVLAAARAVRDRAWGRRVTFSPKVFLPLTNLCRNRCDYCSFRRSPGDLGAYTMRPDEVDAVLSEGRAHGCTEALFCLGDKPEAAFGAYRRELAAFGQDSTVSYLVEAGQRALAHGLLPHTNAGVLSAAEMERLRRVNVSLGLMLENVSPRLCEPGMPHYRAPDKRPAVRLRMMREAGELRIPFTTGILVGIGETRRERTDSLLALRALHEAHGHVQEVIVQPFRARPAVAMAEAPDPEALELAHAIALARLILPEDVSVQSPPNLGGDDVRLLLEAGVNDLGGISPVTPDFISPRHPWPHLGRLGEICADSGYLLEPRLAIYDAFVRPDFVDPGLMGALADARRRLSEAAGPLVSGEYRVGPEKSRAPLVRAASEVSP